MAGKGGGVTLGFLKFVLGLDGLAFEEGLNLSSKQLKAAQKDFEKTGNQIGNLGKTLSLGITAPFVAMAANSVKGAQEQAAAMAQVTASLVSMGTGAGRTAEQLAAAADAFEANSLVDAEVILKDVTAVLLTFGNVAGTVFDQAQQAALDMAQKFGTDPSAAAVMLGKALQAPVTGVSALTKVGVSFSPVQKEMIKNMVETGNVAGAQAIILQELQKQVGGAAAAAANVDPWRKVTVAMGQVGDKIGTALMPVIPPVADALVGLLNSFAALSPETQKYVVIAAAAGAAFGPLLVGAGALISSVGTMIPLLVKTVSAFSSLGVALVTKVIPALLTTLPTLLPLLLPLAAVAGAVALVYAAWKNWPEIVKFVQAVYTGVKTWLIDKLDGVWTWIIGKIDVVKKAFYNLYDAVVGNSYIPDMVDGIGASMARLDQLLVGKAKDVTDKAKAIFAAMADETQGIFERFANAGNSPLTKNQAVAPDGLVDFGRIDQEISDWANGLPRAMVEPAQNATIRTANAFANMARDIGDSISNISNAIKGGDFLDILASVADVFSKFVGNTSALSEGSSSGGGDVGFGGARALGGPVVPGRTYLVGENGPEFMTPGARGFITPNNDNGGRGGSRVQIVPSPYFNVVVDGRAQAVAQPMVGSGMVQASQGAQVAMMRRGSRRLA